jgi:SEC-C motif-containing protein
MATAGRCPCGSGAALVDCCAPYLDDGVLAPSALALMRSRYTAYTLQRADYVRDTWHPTTRPANLEIDAALRWLGLKIISTENGMHDDETGTVEFVARVKRDGRAQRLHETSRFERVMGCWLYRDGDSHVR